MSPVGLRIILHEVRQLKGAAIQYNDLSEELKAKAKACKSPQEILDLAKAEGIELSDENLEAVSGGWGCDDYACDGYEPYPDFVYFV